MKPISSVFNGIKIPIPVLAKGERGVTGLETAIILIAFVVVASVFAFTVLSTGIFSAERGKETVLAGLEQASASVQLKGSVIANGVVDTTLSNADSTWNALSSISATRDATDKKQGDYSAELTVQTAFTTGLVAYENISPTVDLSSHDSIQLWVKSSRATTSGQLRLVLDDSEGCASASENIDLPALAANTWKLATVGIAAGTTRTAVACVGLNVSSDLSTSGATTVNMDDIFARGQANSLVIALANSVEGEPIDLTAPSDSDADGISDTADRTHKLLITYSDADQIVNDLYWTKSFVGNNDDDDLLEVGERGELTIGLSGLNQATPLIRNKEFTIEVKPDRGSVLVIQRHMPAKIDAVMNIQ